MSRDLKTSCLSLFSTGEDNVSVLGGEGFSLVSGFNVECPSLLFVCFWLSVPMQLIACKDSKMTYHVFSMTYPTNLTQLAMLEISLDESFQPITDNQTYVQNTSQNQKSQPMWLCLNGTKQMLV